MTVQTMLRAGILAPLNGNSTEQIEHLARRYTKQFKRIATEVRLHPSVIPQVEVPRGFVVVESRIAPRFVEVGSSYNHPPAGTFQVLRPQQPEPPVKCPRCGGQYSYRAQSSALKNGETAYKFRCRECRNYITVRVRKDGSTYLPGRRGGKKTA